MKTKKKGLEKVGRKQIIRRKSLDIFGQRTSQYRGVTRFVIVHHPNSLSIICLSLFLPIFCSLIFGCIGTNGPVDMKLTFGTIVAKRKDKAGKVGKVSAGETTLNKFIFAWCNCYYNSLISCVFCHVATITRFQEKQCL